MSTVSYNEAAQALGISYSSVMRRVRLTGIPIDRRGGWSYIDLDTLRDAWEGRQQAMQEAMTPIAGVPLTASIRKDQRDAMQEEADRRDVSLATIVREVLDLGIDEWSRGGVPSA